MNVTLETPDATTAEGVVVDALFDALYAELHRLAQRELSRNGPVGGLAVTSLVHDAYQTVWAREGTVVVGHSRILASTARAMRGLIIDDARRCRVLKPGGLFHMTSPGADQAEHLADPHTLTQIGEALDELAAIEPELAEIVDLKVFCGFSLAEIAAIRGVAERTIQRNWEKGRLYLHHAIGAAGPIAMRPHAAIRS
jgi:RNA polymerase sigma factor (TIGR02999 family)